MERRVNTMARLPSQTCCSDSSSTQGTPKRANSKAAVRPTGPPPAITTGCIGCAGCCEGNQGWCTV